MLRLGAARCSSQSCQELQYVRDIIQEVLGFLRTVQAKIFGRIGRSGFVTVLNMLSNITVSGEFPFSTIRCMTFSTARPLLTPCIRKNNRFDHIRRQKEAFAFDQHKCQSLAYLWFDLYNVLAFLERLILGNLTDQ